jgi:hypothetical protein
VRQLLADNRITNHGIGSQVDIMSENDIADPKQSRSAESSSFLVRLWREPQADGEGPVRVYLRNLKTGEEIYLGDPRRVGEILDLEADATRQDVEDDERQAGVQAG